MNYLGFFFIIFSFLLLQSFSAGEDWQLFLKSQKSIRLFVANTPGMGHQSHSFKLLRRFVELGWEGEVEVVLEDEEVLEKLVFLCPKYRDIRLGDPDFLEPYKNHTLGFCEPVNGMIARVTAFNNRFLKTEMDLFLSGGIDESSRYLNHFNTKYGIILNPMKWTISSKFFSKRNKSRFLFVDFLSDNIQALHTPEKIEFPLMKVEKIYQDFRVRNGAESKNILTSLENIFSGIESIPSWAIYGLYEKIGGISDKPKAQNRLLNLLNSFKEMREQFPKNLGIYVFHSLGHGYRELYPSIVKEIEKLGFPVLKSTLEINKKYFEQKLPPVIFLGEVPNPILNRFLYSSNLIPVVAGQGTRNFMDYNGRPYLSFAGTGIFNESLGEWDKLMKDVGRPDLVKSLSRSSEDLFGYFSFEYDNPHIEPAQRQVTSTLSGSIDPKNKLRSIFELYAKRVQKTDQKVVVGLREVVKVLIDEGLWIPCKKKLSE